MSSRVFKRVDSYETSSDSGIEDAWLGPVPTPVWLCGSGPSLTPETAAAVRRSGAPVMCVNFSGRGPDGTEPMLRPDFWTAFDPTARFHKSIFLNPRTTKFVPRHFFLDIVPGTTYKVCDCPSVHFFEREHRGYADFLAPCSGKILDCLDSLGQAIDILFRLGFRTIYTIGTEMRVRLSAEQLSLLSAAGVTTDPELGILLPPAKQGGRANWSTRLMDVLTAARNVPPSDRDPGQIRLGEDRTAVAKAFEEVDRERQYAFSEQKRFLSAVTTDQHYFNVVQFLRLSRRCFVKHGLRLVDCSGGRLSEFFEHKPAAAAADEILSCIGDPVAEPTLGRYENRNPEADKEPGRITMVDIPPHRWDRTSKIREAGEGGGCGCGKKKRRPPADAAVPAEMRDERDAVPAPPPAVPQPEVVVDEVA